MCKTKIKKLKGNIKRIENKELKTKSFEQRLKKLSNEDLVVYILDDESKNNLCRHLNDSQMEADSYNINYQKSILPVFFINTEILKWILLNWKKSNGNKGFLYEKILHKEKKSKKWTELKI